MGKKSQIRREKKEQFDRERKDYKRVMEEKTNPWLLFWKRFDFWIYVVCFAAIIAFPFLRKDVFQDLAVIHTSKGDIEVEFYSNDAPKTVANFKGLAADNFYNNQIWHRVIKGFMVQSGDPTGEGTGGQSIYGDQFEDEINPKALGLTTDQIKQNTDKGYKYSDTLNSHKMTVGALAMANAGPNTNLSQFFIVTEKDQPHLDGQHTVFGRVIKGLDIAKAISEVPTDDKDKPIDPVYITSIELK